MAAALSFALPVVAQQRGRVSPHEAVSGRIDGVNVMVVYGRPYTKDPRSGEPRKIWGGVVPYGRVWRAGSDEATLLVPSGALKFGDVTVPAGAVYSLYMLPQEDGAKLIINKQVGQWGTQYSEGQDLGRVDMKKEALDTAVDQFTIAIERNPSGGGILKLMWEKTAYSVPFTVQR
jgi:hypothetical protein